MQCKIEVFTDINNPRALGPGIRLGIFSKTCQLFKNIPIKIRKKTFGHVGIGSFTFFCFKRKTFGHVVIRKQNGLSKEKSNEQNFFRGKNPQVKCLFGKAKIKKNASIDIMVRQEEKSDTLGSVHFHFYLP